MAGSRPRRVENPVLLPAKNNRAERISNNNAVHYYVPVFLDLEASLAGFIWPKRI